MKKEGGAGGAKKKGGRDASNSLIVMALKRLTPVGMNLFAGREQELVQHVKDRFLQVSPSSIVIYRLITRILTSKEQPKILYPTFTQRET